MNLSESHKKYHPNSKVVTLSEAIAIARTVEVCANKYGHYVALAGSCLWKGESSNDVDLIIYPHRGEESTTEAVYTAIAECLGAKAFFQVKHETPSHLVIRLDIGALIVDLFFIHEDPTRFDDEQRLAIRKSRY